MWSARAHMFIIPSRRRLQTSLDFVILPEPEAYFLKILPIRFDSLQEFLLETFWKTRLGRFPDQSSRTSWAGRTRERERKSGHPTGPFTNFELRNPSHDVSELRKFCQSPDFEAWKLWKGRSGSCSSTFPNWISNWKMENIVTALPINHPMNENEIPALTILAKMELLYYWLIAFFPAHSTLSCTNEYKGLFLSNAVTETISKRPLRSGYFFNDWKAGFEWVWIPTFVYHW